MMIMVMMMIMIMMILLITHDNDDDDDDNMNTAHIPAIMLVWSCTIFSDTSFLSECR